MDCTTLTKNYLRDVLMCSSKWNLNYYIKLTEGTELKGREACVRYTEIVYDNKSARNLISIVDNAYQRLEPYIRDGNLKVADNMKSLISDTIRFLAEDAKNAERLSTSGVDNVQVIKDFATKNIERLRIILQLC
jgi:macrodomain Ter protein organizer (MatP/YcbG family)